MISGATVLLEKKEGDGGKWNKIDTHDAWGSIYARGRDERRQQL